MLLKILVNCSFVIFVLLVSGCLSTSQLGSASANTYEYKLENGLLVLVKPDHRAPVVVSQIWYKVGSSYEPNGLTGISHLLEHMMFKGTSRLAANEFSEIIAGFGGSDNAFTGRDYTAYYQKVEKSKLATVLELEADRMINLALDPVEFDKERKVVQEERRLRTDDKPEGLAYEQFNALAFKRSSYRNPVIGSVDDIAGVSIDDLREWYTRYYAPNNATLVVVGDVDPEQVIALAEKYFANIPSRLIESFEDPTEPPQDGFRHAVISDHRVRVPSLIMGYHTPNISLSGVQFWEPYALEILAYLLNGGKSARLNRRLVREQEIAASVGASYNSTTRKNSLFVVTAKPSKNRTIAALQTALLIELTAIKGQLVTQQELDRIKAQLVASRVFETDSIFNGAMRLGLFETNEHGWRAGEQFNNRLRQVTAKQIMHVARKYLTTDNLTAVVLQPNTKGDN